MKSRVDRWRLTKSLGLLQRGHKMETGTEAAAAGVMLHFTQKGEPVRVKERDFITSECSVHTVELHTCSMSTFYIALYQSFSYNLQTTWLGYITKILACNVFEEFLRNIVTWV